MDQPGTPLDGTDNVHHLQTPGKKGEKRISKEDLAVNTRAPRGGGRDVETESGCVQARAGDINFNPHTHIHTCIILVSSSDCGQCPSKSNQRNQKTAPLALVTNCQPSSTLGTFLKATSSRGHCSHMWHRESMPV